MSFLSVFSAPKPFTNPHIATIQLNAIQSWQQLGPEVEVILVGAEAGIADAAERLNVKHLPDVRLNAQGTPLVSSIFELARTFAGNNSPFLAYVNADILLLPDFVETTRQVAGQLQQFLLVGQRWDLDITTPLDFSTGWQAQLQETIRAGGRLHPLGGSDYFIFPRSCFTRIPDFAIGRAGWDNWMIYEARRSGWRVVDATQGIRLVHQSHDYSHLPDGKPHYRLPETFENVRLAGGARTILTLRDCDARCDEHGKVLAPAPTWQKFWREVEIFPLVRLHSYALAQLAYALFHPVKAYRELRAWL
ncbi:MAG: hypothetical protein P4L50_12050 [Anaerolineaceae bacterium]|nr:hypothetical protein [Anaerolineaceae bacterium]